MSGYNCDECGWHGETPASTTIIIGGRPKEFLNVCPECFGVNSTIIMCCYEIGCKNEASCGTPHGINGYKRHCHLHPPNVRDHRAGPATNGEQK
jgi:hypothetical protein